MNVPLNQIIYGVLFHTNSHKYYTDINFNDSIKIVLNCRKCKMCYYTNNSKEKEMDKNCKIPFEPSKDKYLLIQNNNLDINKINYVIFTDNQNYNETIYYSIYIYNNKLPKFINQNTPEFCETPCKFIFPIYQFYNYNQNNIILYVPNDEQVIIYEKIIKMNEFHNYNDYNLRSFYNNSSKISLISNKLIINIEEIKKFNDNVYVQIQINSKFDENEKKNITFITSQFYNSLNTEMIPNYQNIYLINDNKSEINNILKNHNINKLYKIDISLIEGSGLFMLNNNNNQNINYSLSYDTQERISFILKFNNNKNNILKAKKNLEENSFIYYINMDEKEDWTNSDELILSKTNYFNYFKDNNNIFPINYKLQLNMNNNNDLYINLQFSKLIKQNNSNEDIIDVLNEKFDIKVYNITFKEGKNKERKEIKEIAKYYCDLRRGYIHLEKSNINNQNYIEIEIDKNKMNKNNYERVSLDITPFDLNNTIELPRNNYLEMKINKNIQNIKLSKPRKDYKNIYIELSSNDKFDFSLGNISYNKTENINGKNYYSFINDEQTEYTMTLNSNKTNNNIGTILLKYITKKDNITHFYLKNNDIISEKIDNKNYVYKLNHSNIINENKLYYNYNLSYLIRLYNSFSFENNNQPKNIFVEEEPIFCFRKKLNESEKKSDSIEYIIDFGKLIRSKYYISILAEVVNDSNIEYFAFNNIEFTVKRNINEFKFDYTWIIIILILLSMLIFSTYFLVKVYVNMKNNKENDFDEKDKDLIIKSIN